MKKVFKIGLASTSLITLVSLGVGGIASASSITASTQGPNSGISIHSSGSGVYQASYNQEAGNWQGGWNDGSDWSSHNPMSWQNGDRSCDQWWGDMMGTMSHYKASNWQRNKSSGDRGNWQPEGDNWQADWNNWNPVMWQEHNQSYGRWHAQMSSYLNRHKSNWQQNWKMVEKHEDNRGPQPDQNSQDQADHDNNYTTAYVPVHYQSQNDSWGNSNNWGNNGGNNQHYMPSYLNLDYVNRRNTTISNWVSVSNNNNQNVQSGNASSWGNTYSGNVWSGDATANNSTSTDISI